MRVIPCEEFGEITGGEDESAVQTVTVTGTQAQVAAAKLEAMGPFLVAFGSFAAAAVTTGACIGIPAALSGPAAPEVAAALGKPCASIGGVAGSFMGIWIAQEVKDYVKAAE